MYTGKYRNSRLAGNTMIAIDGIKVAAAILNCFNQHQGEALLDALQVKDLSLAEKIRSQLFVFDDFADIDDRSMQTLIAKLPREILPLALRGITGACLQKFLTNMSANAALMLKEELDSFSKKTPVRVVSEVDKARKVTIDLARQLEATGEMLLKQEGLYL